jgi:hypothetical protein
MLRRRRRRTAPTGSAKPAKNARKVVRKPGFANLRRDGQTAVNLILD